MPFSFLFFNLFPVRLKFLRVFSKISFGSYDFFLSVWYTFHYEAPTVTQTILFAPVTIRFVPQTSLFAPITIRFVPQTILFAPVTNRCYFCGWTISVNDISST